MLWVLAFLSLAIAGFTLAARSHVQEASAEAASADAASLADAGVHVALGDLVNAQWARTWRRRFPPDGTAQTCSLDGGRLVVTVSDEAGRIDLNGATPEILTALFTGLGRSRDDARGLAAKLVDWRDADSRKSPDGAEGDDYRDAGRPGPKNALFVAPEELAQVLGFDAALLAQLRPFVTVHTGIVGIDPTKASPELVAVLAGTVAAGGGAVMAGLQRSRLPPSFVEPSSQRLFRIRAQALTGRGAAFAREVVVQVIPGRTRLYTVLAWVRVDALSIPQARDLGAC